MRWGRVRSRPGCLSLSTGKWRRPMRMVRCGICRGRSWRRRRSWDISSSWCRAISCGWGLLRPTMRASASSRSILPNSITRGKRHSCAPCNRASLHWLMCRPSSFSASCCKLPGKAFSAIPSMAATAIWLAGSCWVSQAHVPISWISPIRTARNTLCRRYRSAMPTLKPEGNVENTMAEIKMQHTDVVIVGFGWTGAIMAKELSDAGLRVVALERGVNRDLSTDDLYPGVIDELTYGTRGKLFQNLSRETVTIRHAANGTAVPYRQLHAFLPGDGVGGAGLHWGGVHFR